jgi:multidrug efflux system outer membrane protein
MRRKLQSLVAAALVLNGCTMIPKYTRPALPVPLSWPDTAAVSTDAPARPAVADIRWQEFFADQRLRSVVELALANNRDLRVATLNIEKAQALYRIQRSELFPGVGVMATGEKYRVPEKMSANGQATTVEQVAVTVGVSSWELDLFGRIRSLKAGALEQYLATEQARHAAQTSLVAAVAGGYLALAADRESLELARATLDAQQATLDLIQKSRDAGVASDLDVRQSQSQVEAARVAVAQFTGLAAVDRNNLDLLAGASVPAALLPDRLGAATTLAALSPGLPSEVLLRRPDILMAEHQLKAANANIGAARAAFFPSITLTGGIGSMSPELSGLFESGTRTWSFTPQVVAPIFAGGSLRANLKAARVDREIAVAQYEKAIQVAFGEVSDALTLRDTLAAQLEAQAALVSALEETYRLSNARYKAGIDSYLSVLVAQRSTFAAQQGLVSTRLAEQANVVTLYKVLGGGIEEVSGPTGPATGAARSQSASIW